MFKGVYSKFDSVSSWLNCVAFAIRKRISSSRAFADWHIFLPRYATEECSYADQELIHLESPRWYIKKHRYLDAFSALQRLRNTSLQAARDLYYIHAQVRLEEMMLGDGDILVTEGKERYSRSGRYSSRFVQLFTIARIRRATLAAFVVMIAQQMCGSRFRNALQPSRADKITSIVNIMAFYSSTLFVDAKATERSALLVSWGFGLINFA